MICYYVHNKYIINYEGKKLGLSMKKIIILVTIVLLSGCVESEELISDNQNEYYNEYLNIKQDEIMLLEYNVDLLHNVSDPKVMNALAEYIIIAKVTSIDGGSNYNEILNEYISPYTYGKLEIIDVLKGDINEKEVIFVRGGGIIAIDEYIKSLYPAQKEKFIANLNGRQDGYIEVKFLDDIDIEVGKTYLIYMNKGEVLKEESYTIIGMAGGLREVDTSNNESDLKVYNNYTNQWELLSTIIEKQK